MCTQELNFDFPKQEEKEIKSSTSTSLHKLGNDPKGEGKKESQDFEKSLKRLETIVHEMENNDLTLNQSMKYFEEGTKLANYCSTKLSQTENKIEILLKNSDEKKWSDFEQESSE